MNPTRFQALADQGYNRIPVFRQISADLDTPLSVYLKLADGPSAFLLEFVQRQGEDSQDSRSETHQLFRNISHWTKPKLELLVYFCNPY